MTKQKLLNKPFGLIIVQPTSFCNIECDYCYLSDTLKNEKGVMKDEILHKICERTFFSSLIEQTNAVRFTWHAGEPMAVPISFYKNALSIISQYKPENIQVLHQIVTNGMFINDEWCKFFKENNFELVISVDGPEFINDTHRKKRNGKGTFKEVLNGITKLRNHEISFYVLTTVTDITLDHPNELHDFYISLDIKDIGLNFEEVLAHNIQTSLTENDNLTKVEDFIRQFYSLTKNSNIHIREFDSVKGYIFFGDEFDSIQADSISPLSIIAVDKNGNFSTFSQELLDMKHERFEDFIIGNVMTDSFEDSLNSTKFKSIYEEILKGVDACQNSCEYFDVCGGGMPSAKLSINSKSPFYGRFDGTESLYCKMSVQKVADIILEDLQLLSHKNKEVEQEQF